ncbi:hydrolase 1, exosortase A system-associated [Noviherbaspirillum autotrophicum]|uniref:Hydrolase n=1 Tax=Noviherbaspirillum autotrophicum TaxID=709839 RepID=A0A0C2BUZ3_9BURK|nr:hydrolase 1, exosortase A system-associated [Noviherbaspirillum autotrophicum]KIF81846.1 hydrolase [Noviherbaspirillum autotrophicum]
MTVEERPLCFSCHDAALYGILSVPRQPRSRAVLIVVGGPQYRAGSHRQFVLLARALASHGYPVLRFDYRGMGDSEGEPRNFERVDDDLRVAVDQLLAAIPSICEVVMWGLCDGASASLFYAYRDARVSGMVLVNPWAHTEQGAAKAHLKHYYRTRLTDPALWRKIMRGEFQTYAAMHSLRTMVHCAFSTSNASTDTNGGMSLPDRLHYGLTQFSGKVLIILSENDLTAQEFRELAQGTSSWRKLMHASRVQRFDLRGANHTFARRDWREQVIGITLEWLHSLPAR